MKYNSQFVAFGASLMAALVHAETHQITVTFAGM